jgi:hypothetical protein
MDLDREGRLKDMGMGLERSKLRGNDLKFRDPGNYSGLDKSSF